MTHGARPTREVDPWRFTGSFIRRALSERIADAPEVTQIPWTPFSKPLSEARVALLSTAGISMRGDPPFDMDTERRRPTWGEPSWRALRADATADSVEVHPLHIDTGYIERDLAVALPLDPLRELMSVGIRPARATADRRPRASKKLGSPRCA